MHESFGLSTETGFRTGSAKFNDILECRQGNSYLARPGDRMKHIFLVVDGWAARYRLLNDGRRQITAIFLPGDLCDIAWRGGAPATQHVIALTPMRELRIDLYALERQLEEDPGVRAVVDRETQILAEAQCEWLVSLGRRNAVERLAHLFCELVERIGRTTANGVGQCEVPLTQTDIADITGLTPVHVNRTIQKMRRSGLIELKSHRLRLRDFARIRKIAFFRSTAAPHEPRNRVSDALNLFCGAGEQCRLAHAEPARGSADAVRAARSSAANCEGSRATLRR